MPYVGFLSNVSSQTSFLFIHVIINRSYTMETVNGRRQSSIQFVALHNDGLHFDRASDMDKRLFVTSDEFHDVPIERRIHFAEFTLKHLVPSAFWLVHRSFSNIYRKCLSSSCNRWRITSSPFCRLCTSVDRKRQCGYFIYDHLHCLSDTFSFVKFTDHWSLSAKFSLVHDH